MPPPVHTTMRLRQAGDGVSVAIESNASEVARMRELVRGLLPEWMPAEERNDTIVVVSELVTNALVHGLPPRFLRLQLSDDALIIEVADGSPAAAAPVDPVGRIGGRGLRIVEALSTRWGSSSNPDGAAGKQVWCAMRTTPDTTQSV